MKCPIHNVDLLCPGCIGAKGGSARSPAKTAAVRQNAKLGGWPKGRKRGARITDEALAVGEVKQAESES